ncbi:MAG: glycogen synthase GlgA [Nitrospiraceae bacterium]|nr:glycogen synthase GlgA [Nitrospiraceae bacterium]
MASSEAVPFAKTGGLADVVGALAVEFCRLGHDVNLLIPGYRQLLAAASHRKEVARLVVPTVSGMAKVGIHEISAGGESQPAGAGRLRIFAISHDASFDRAGLYQEGGADYPDNLERFSLFCRAVMEWLVFLGEHESWYADILHLHDWQTALCAAYQKTLYQTTSAFKNLRTILTVHNLGYQGLFPGKSFPTTGLPVQYFGPKHLEFYGSVNLLKGGLVFSDALTTVSPTYSREIQTKEFGFGLEGVLEERKGVLHGIVNGIDDSLWNPATDPHLRYHYSVEDLSGKARCKSDLQKEVGLPQQSVPLLSVIARLTSQKGIDLIVALLPELIELDLQLVVLGTGDQMYERTLTEWAERYPKKIAFRQAFDEGLAHRIEAGADLFLMPSRYEPCGLSQLYSLRYGTVPIVRKTGGLADTVCNYAPVAAKAKRSTGFVFVDSSSESLLASIMLALEVYRDKAEWRGIATAGMRQELNWQQSAAKYIQLFHSVSRKEQQPGNLS